jgi:ankyrin repeat protein
MSLWKKLFGAKESPSPVILVSPAEWASLHEAARKGNLEPLKALLKDNPGLVLSKDEDGVTLLHLAASLGHKDMAEFLIANKLGNFRQRIDPKNALDLG